MEQQWNTLIHYLSNPEPLAQTYDLAILAGNCLPYLADELAKLYQSKRVKQVMVVGGIGHATHFLRENFQKIDILVPNASEAEMYQSYLMQRYQLSEATILMEKDSKNSGENASKSLAVLKQIGPIPNRILLLQDPLLQRRLKASFVREWQTTESQFTNYVPKIPFIHSAKKTVIFDDPIFQTGWTDTYFLSLALGEIPRLRNDLHGYGPKGKNFIDAITIPAQVEQAYAQLIAHYGQMNDR